MLLVSLLFNVSVVSLAIDESIDVASAKIRQQAAVGVLLKADPGGIVETDENGKFSEILVGGEAINDEVFSELKNFPEVNTLLGDEFKGHRCGVQTFEGNEEHNHFDHHWL